MSCVSTKRQFNSTVQEFSYLICICKFSYNQLIQRAVGVLVIVTMMPGNLPVASNGIKDLDSKDSNYHTTHPRRSSIAVESLGCLSLLEPGDKMSRPRAFPTPGQSDGNLRTCIRAQLTEPFPRPRAVLSSPQNDELICESQAPVDPRASSAVNAPRASVSSVEEISKAVLSSMQELPRAPLSCDEDLMSTGRAETRAMTQSYCHDSNPLRFSKDMADAMKCKITSKEEEPELQDTGNLLEPKCSREIANTEGSAKSRAMHKKHNYLPSNAAGSNVKQKLIKPRSKDNAVRVIRPWY